MATLPEVAEPYYRRFRSACDDPELAQRRFLRDVLKTNAACEFGRQHRFERIDNPEQYLDAMPARSYRDMQKALDACRNGRPTLTAEPIIHWERTSGSTCRSKTIPYTASGLRGFHEAIFPWLFDLEQSFPGTLGGHIYWSASPRISPRSEVSDAIYLAPIAHLLPRLGSVPFAVSSLPSIEEWRFWTAFFLAADVDLRLISVWSPTFLFPLFDTIAERGEEFAAFLRGDWPGTIPSLLRDSLPPRNERRAKQIENFAAGGLQAGRLWPKLKLISCWADGSSRRFAVDLDRRCPGVPIQPKGLLATEAAMSVPIAAAPAPVLAINSAFFELHRADGCIVLAQHMREEDEGVLVVTTRSGLWRYRTGDRVRVKGFWHRTPCIEFLGREGIVSDLCGEKLDESSVADSLPQGIDAFLAASLAPKPRYWLFLDSTQTSRDAARQHAENVEQALLGFHHYGLARRLGQLEAVSPVRIWQLLPAVIGRLAERSGAAFGAVKPPLLGSVGWLDYFVERGLVIS